MFSPLVEELACAPVALSIGRKFRVHPMVFALAMV
jgi:hypothetical protein